MQLLKAPVDIFVNFWTLMCTIQPQYKQLWKEYFVHLHHQTQYYTEDGYLAVTSAIIVYNTSPKEEPR